MCVLQSFSHFFQWKIYYHTIFMVSFLDIVLDGKTWEMVIGGHASNRIIVHSDWIKFEKNVGTNISGIPGNRGLDDLRNAEKCKFWV
jgi:hypothetical protein